MFFLWNGKKCRRNCAICPACWQRVCRRKDEPAREGFPVSNALSERPAAAQTRERIGDREAATVAGVTGGAVLLTNRKIRFLFLCAPGEEDGERGKRGGDGGVGSRILLPAPVPAVGAWDE